MFKEVSRRQSRKPLFKRAIAAFGVTLMAAGLTVAITPSANAADYGDVAYTISGNYVTVTGRSQAAINANKTDIVIPSIIGGRAVTTIGDSAFYKNQLTSVIIPDSVTNINQSAFYINNLTSVTIGNSVTFIGPRAFAINQLTSITIPGSVTRIRQNAFEQNQLISVTIPDSVTTISVGAFAKNQLTSVIIGNSVTSLSGSTFSNNKLSSVTIPGSITTIGNNVFKNNPLEWVNFEGQVINIDSDMVDGDWFTDPGLTTEWNKTVPGPMVVYSSSYVEPETQPSVEIGDGDDGTATILVDSSISLTMEDNEVAIADLPGVTAADSPDSDMSYRVKSNAINGYTVSAVADSESLISSDLNNFDSLPVNLLTIEQPDAATNGTSSGVQTLSHTEDRLLYSQNERSGADGDIFTSLLSLTEVPFVNADDYSGTITLTATTN